MRVKFSLLLCWTGGRGGDPKVVDVLRRRVAQIGNAAAGRDAGNLYLGIFRRDQQMLLAGNSSPVVIECQLVAIKRKPVLQFAPDMVDGERKTVRVDGGKFLRQRARGEFLIEG